MFQFAHEQEFQRTSPAQPAATAFTSGETTGRRAYHPICSSKEDINDNARKPMRTKLSIPSWLALAALATLNLQPSTAFAQGTAFNYQGQLSANGAPANGSYDLTFTLYDSLNTPGNVHAGPLTNTATAVRNGLFAVTLDFGGNVFTGPAR